MAIKILVLLVLGLAAGRGRDSALALAAVLPQGGEFAFVLFGEATSVGAVDRPTADFLILAVAISMVLTPISVALAARLRRVFDRSPVAEAPLPDIEEQEAREIGRASCRERGCQDG